jgi:hypothetical protein
LTTKYFDHFVFDQELEGAVRALASDPEMSPVIPRDRVTARVTA